MEARAMVLVAAQARAAALANGDAAALTALLHPELAARAGGPVACFRWTTHTGLHLDRAAYVARNTDGTTTWRSQTLHDPEVTVVGDTAVLRAEVTDVVATGEGDAPFRMPMTQVWVRVDGRWRCLAGHAGPRLSGAHGTTS